MKRTSRGNILFLILLAVVLFAALAYAVTSSMRGGGKDGGDEKAKAQASELMNYFTELQTAIQRMMLVGDVKDYQLNFRYQSSSYAVVGGFDNPNCTESRCRVFDPAGGGVAVRSLDNYLHSAAHSSDKKPRIFYADIPGVGTSAPDIILAVQGIKLSICRAINQLNNVGNDVLYNILSYTGGAATDVIMYQNAIPTGPIPDVGASIPVNSTIGNTHTFCACQYTTESACTVSSRPIIYYVLVAR